MTEKKMYVIYKMYKCVISENMCPGTKPMQISKAKAPNCKGCELYVKHKKAMESV